MRYIPDNNLGYPVLIKIGTGLGSGFYFQLGSKLFIATALHVLFDIQAPGLPLRAESAILISYDEDQSKTEPIIITVDLKLATVKKDDSKDIAIIELGNENANTKGYYDFCKGTVRTDPGEGKIVIAPSELLKRFNDVLISNEVFILGYPMSIGMPGANQIEPDRPLLRKGIVAGVNRINNTIILDCPVYFGNSGGIVIEVEEPNFSTRHFKIIGIVTQFIPFVKELKSVQLGYTNVDIENSGYSVAIPLDTIFELAEL